jgi:hypothetical protein
MKPDMRSKRVSACIPGELGRMLSVSTALHIRRRTNPYRAARDYVLNLDAWYAQSHPAEDFAETFAVWLKPGSSGEGNTGSGAHCAKSSTSSK